MQTNTPSTAASDTMQIRFCALILGTLFLSVGLAGFLFHFSSDPANAVLGPGYSRVLGVLPTNHLHNAVRVLVGLLGIAAFTSLGGSIAYNRAFAVAYAAIAVLGLLPFTNTLFGTMPIYGGNVLVSLLSAGAAYYFGFIKPDTLNIGLSANR